MPRVLFVVTVALVTLAACTGAGAPSTSPSAVASATTSPTPAPTSARTPAPTPVQLAADIDIGGRTLHLFCVGTARDGQPTVIGESGLTGDSRTWNDIFYAVAERTRVCAYDRAGLNQSPPAAASVRTLQDQVDDLHALIAAADLGGPIILAAHSSGAWNVALYTSQHPDDVAGIVLADPRGSRVSAEWLAALPPERAGEPEAIALNRDELTRFEADPSLNDEHLDLRDAAQRVNAVLDPETPLYGNRPLIVLQAGLTAMSWSDLPERLRVQFDRIWVDGQRAYLGESTNSSAVAVADSDHDLPFMRPDAIIDALFDVLDQVGS
ncbi:MAG TPA: alpha/beta fold hydrolase [Candidatus Limnocylindrales bacterium]|jgi:pimeloyl-ACP methyl ester carboxylesterase